MDKPQNMGSMESQGIIGGDSFLEVAGKFLASVKENLSELPFEPLEIRIIVRSPEGTLVEMQRMSPGVEFYQQRQMDPLINCLSREALTAGPVGKLMHGGAEAINRPGQYL